MVGAAYRAPRASHPDMAALEVLDAILSAGENNRLDAALVKPGLSTDAGTNLFLIEEQSLLAAYGFVAGGKEEATVAAELNKALTRLRTAPPTAAEVMEAKNELLAASLGERETFSGRAFELGEAYVRTGDPRIADKRLAAIARVRPGRRAAGRQAVPQPVAPRRLPLCEGRGRCQAVGQPDAAAQIPHAAAGDGHAQPASRRSRAAGAARAGRQGRITSLRRSPTCGCRTGCA